MTAAGAQPCCLEGHRRYDVLLLVKRGKLKATKWWEITLPSAMYRRCIGVDVVLPATVAVAAASGSSCTSTDSTGSAGSGSGSAAAAPHVVQVATVHLESTSSGAKYRAKQLDLLATELGKGKAPGTTTMLCGDMNMCASCDEENSRIEANYDDCWPIVVGKRNASTKPKARLKEAAAVARWHADQGFTEDTSVNKMRFQMNLEHAQVRIDRILIQKASAAAAKQFAIGGAAAAAAGSGGGWRPETIQLLGTRELCTTTPRLGGGFQKSTKKELSVFPSDHFGLVAALRYSR